MLGDLNLTGSEHQAPLSFSWSTALIESQITSHFRYCSIHFAIEVFYVRFVCQQLCSEFPEKVPSPACSTPCKTVRNCKETISKHSDDSVIRFQQQQHNFWSYFWLDKEFARVLLSESQKSCRGQHLQVSIKFLILLDHYVLSWNLA